MSLFLFNLYENNKFNRCVIEPDNKLKTNYLQFKDDEKYLYLIKCLPFVKTP